MVGRPETCIQGHSQSRAVWSLSEPLVWLELGHPSCLLEARDTSWAQ